MIECEACREDVMALGLERNGDEGLERCTAGVPKGKQRFQGLERSKASLLKEVKRVLRFEGLERSTASVLKGMKRVLIF